MGIYDCCAGVCINVWVLEGRQGEGWGGDGKRKKQREKGKEESHELSLKMNEKMGNPRVTA